MGKILNYEHAISSYLSGMSLSESANLHKVDRHTLKTKLNRNGVSIRPPQSYWTYNLNHSAFDTITEESAYWIGFLMADGCIHNPENETPEIRLDLSSKDVLHIEQLKRFVSAEHPIRTRSVKLKSGNTATYSLLVFRSQQIADRLATFGVVPDKTSRETVMILENNRHFWRGVVDGDGCLTFANKYPSFQLVGSFNLMNQFCTHIKIETGIVTEPRNFNRNVWTVSLYCKKAFQVTEHLYTLAPIALERKRNRANMFGAFYA